MGLRCQLQTAAAAAAARLQLLLTDDHFSTLQSTRHMGTPQNAISNNSRSRLQHVLVVMVVVVVVHHLVLVLLLALLL